VAALPRTLDIASASDAVRVAEERDAASAAELRRRADELTRLESLTLNWDVGHRGIVDAIKTGIEELNAEAFRRMIRTLKADEGASVALRAAVRDPLVYRVLLFHGLVKEPLEHRVARALDEVRPFLKEHGGDVELVAVKFPDTVEVRLIGSCQSCPSSGETLSEGVEKAIKAHCPEIVAVSRVSRGAPEVSVDGAQVVHFVSPFARQQDAGWSDACVMADLPDDGIIVRAVDGRDVLLYRHGDRVSCMDNACAHMGMPLDGGELENGTLRCPYHGFTYLLETGECLTVPEVQLAVHAVKVVGDRVAVRLRR
jgi:nitrite reductase/ring-hydroxylating ferredoxin subunit/Fe-S cluster biogenesis protein NfuA